MLINQSTHKKIYTFLTKSRSKLTYDMTNKYNTSKIIIDKILMKIKYETSR